MADATTVELRPLERRILEAIEAAEGEWLTQADVSRIMGRPKVYPTDVAALDKLVAYNLIDSRQAPRGAGATKWEYRSIANA